MKRLLTAVAAAALFASMSAGAAHAQNRTVVTQSGYANAAGQAQTGNRNGAVINQRGGRHYARGVQDGYRNFMRMDQYGTRNHVATTQVGSDNFSATGQEGRNLRAETIHRKIGADGRDALPHLHSSNQKVNA